MALEHKLELKLLQKLILTPQLQQAIKLLQMPQLELSLTISNELVENPFLEETVEEPSGETTEGLSEADTTEANETEEDTEMPLEKMMSLSSSSVDDYFEERGLDGRDLGYFTPGTVLLPPVEQFVSKPPDLYEHLLWQLKFSGALDDIKDIGQYVIGNIDENGYLRASVEDIAKTANCSQDKATDAIRLIQTFDPLGIGAMDMRECLLIQLKSLNLEGSLAESIVLHNLEDLEKKRYANIAKHYACSIDLVIEAVKVISSLEPKPGRNFASEPPAYITPDVFVTKTEDGYRITLNDEGMPGLRINNFYRKLLLHKNSLPKEDRQYLEEKLRSATWLMKSLDHRNKTIYRVTESILKFQKGFFDAGSSLLKPMNLRDVAEDIGMHESTISRTTANKYLSCSHGILGFRFFFSTGINSDTGKVSSTAVKELIRKIISEESYKKPLSDQKIVELLKQQSITMARRTVAKYRDELKIVSQVQRKNSIKHEEAK
ncbi:MAG: RNA polymerase factor sigma-54 [Nitrospirae bacterium]|nr:RNA polymerase factor sigma-54 [Nitrospirota bacterium]